MKHLKKFNEMYDTSGEASGQEYDTFVKFNEESYTSKASFLDGDDIPTYGDKFTGTFSGKRLKRGLYRSKNGIILNADVNGAYNIMKKQSQMCLQMG